MSIDITRAMFEGFVDDPDDALVTPGQVRGWYIIDGEECSVSEWAARAGVTVSAIRKRVRSGMSLYAALTTHRDELDRRLVRRGKDVMKVCSSCGRKEPHHVSVVHGRPYTRPRCISCYEEEWQGATDRLRAALAARSPARK